MPPKRDPPPAGSGVAEDGTPPPPPAKKAKAKKEELPEIIPQDPAPRCPSLPASARAFTCVSWNVAGLRALMDKHPEALRAIADAESPDVIVLQEHKLQASHVDDLTAKLREILPEYPTARFAVSTAKKGYSGVAVLARARVEEDDTAAGDRRGGEGGGGGISKFFQKKKTDSSPPPSPSTSVTLGPTANRLLRISEGLGPDDKKTFVDEGRVLTMEFDRFFLVVAYVPNSGMKLDRLDYRVDTWDPAFRAYLDSLDGRKPVVFGGDLNVGRLDRDIYNVSAPHVKKSAGLTPRERDSFESLLSSGGFAADGYADTFRAFHPEAAGWFTYWSGRVGNRPKNRGLRLDYFVASARMMCPGGSGTKRGEEESEDTQPAEENGGGAEKEGSRDDGANDEPRAPRVRDAFILDRITAASASDHAPIGVTISL